MAYPFLPMRYFAVYYNIRTVTGKKNIVNDLGFWVLKSEVRKFNGVKELK